MSKSTLRAFTTRDVRLAEHVFRVHAVTAPQGYDPDDAFNPLCWNLSAEQCQMNPGDEIRMVAYDYSWIQTLLITFRKGALVHVRRLSLVVPEARSASEIKVSDEMAQRYEVRYRGRAGWSVMDNKGPHEDALVVAEKLESREHAEKYLNDLLTGALTGTA